MGAVVREPAELIAARAALARAVRADPDEQQPATRSARSRYVLAQARAALAGIMDRADDLTPADQATLATELRQLAAELRHPR